MSAVARRGHGRIWFGEGTEQWSFPDMASVQMCDAAYAARYPAPGQPPNYDVASMAEALFYLTVDCPTTELAIKKLRAVRAALRSRTPNIAP